MDSSVKILLSNLWGAPWPLSKDKSKRFQEFVGFVELEAPQIICLQEVWLKRDFAFLKKQFSNGGYEDCSKAGFIMNKGGLVTFSKFPIQKAEYVSFKKKQGFLESLKTKLFRSESFWPRGFLVVIVEIAGKAFAVVNVHMSYFGQECDKERALGVKNAEFQQLFDFIESVKSDVDGVFVSGDFNIDIDDMPSIPGGLKIISDTSAPTLEGANPYAKMDGYCGPDTTCDFILGPDSLDVIDRRIIKSPLVSDHYMVMGEVEGVI